MKLSYDNIEGRKACYMEGLLYRRPSMEGRIWKAVYGRPCMEKACFAIWPSMVKRPRPFLAIWLGSDINKTFFSLFCHFFYTFFSLPRKACFFAWPSLVKAFIYAGLQGKSFLKKKVFLARVLLNN